MIIDSQMTELGYSLKSYRVRNNITQQELADLSGINIGSINRLIRKLEALHLISVTKIQGGSLIKVHGYTSLIAAPGVKDDSRKRNGRQFNDNLYGN